MEYRINNQIRASEVRLLDGVTGDNLGVVKTREAMTMAKERGLDLIEISDKTNPPIAKIMDYGKFQYEQNKKAKEIKSKAHTTETKSIQIKVGTGEGDLQMKAKKASEWLKEGHRIKVELYLVGRTKFTDNTFKQERLERVLKLITEKYKISEPLKQSPRGVMVTIERDNIKKKDENK
ncbi:MAG: translation initiation factor [Patescibacteria group bacterium]|nr:translation initiation factor [Patescibacteria group bacterium]